jgi:esterase
MILNFKKIGEKGQPVIILHGVFGSLDNWLTIGKIISDKGFVIYLLDQRNHGRSPHEAPLDYPNMSADLDEFIKEHSIVNPILVGHSMGGKTVMQYAVEHPNAFIKMVVVDIAPKKYPIHHQKLLQGLNTIDTEQIQNRNEADQLLSAFEPVVAVRQFLLKNLYRKEEGGFGWRFNLPVLSTDMHKVGHEISKLTTVDKPALFMRGGNSNYVLDEDWKDILDIFPQATLETIPNSGHWVQAEQPKAFVDTLLHFIN